MCDFVVEKFKTNQGIQLYNNRESVIHKVKRRKWITISAVLLCISILASIVALGFGSGIRQLFSF